MVASFRRATRLFANRGLARGPPQLASTSGWAGATTLAVGSVTCALSVANCRSASSCSVVASFFPKCSSAEKKLAEIHEAEAKVLDLMPTAYEARNVSVKLEAPARCCFEEPQSEYTIRTVMVGAEHTDKTPIVLVHGFMMGGAGFFKLLPLLAKHRQVYAIDIIGMGGSGRPPFDARNSTAEEAEELLVAPFERWAEAEGLSKFVLLGHSYGGFVSSVWAARRPESVACLGLLSPLLGFSEEKIDARMTPSPDDSWRQHAFRFLVETAWEHHITPQSLVRRLPFFKGYFESVSIRRFGKSGWVQDMSEEEGRLFTDYLTKTLDTPASAERTATVCFGPLLRAKKVGGLTIKQRVARLQLPVFAIYGDHDWMDKAGQEELPKVEFVELEKSGHHLYFDNPPLLADHILQRIRDL